MGQFTADSIHCHNSLVKELFTIFKMKRFSVVLCLVVAMAALGTDAINRNERNVIRSQGGSWGDFTHEFDQDYFDVSEAECTGKDWGEKIDSWDIVSHSLSEAECGKAHEGWKCLCRAYFSLGAIMGAPHYTCERC